MHTNADGVVLKTTVPGMRGAAADIVREVKALCEVSRAKAPDESTDGLVAKKSSAKTCAEYFAPSERLIILGAGHVSQALCRIMDGVGFDVIVVDDRPEFANKERFPQAKEVICGPFAEAIASLQPRTMDYFVIVTRGHQQDTTCIETIFSYLESVYVGLMGSRKRVKGLFDTLARQGLPKERLDHIHTPIGLSIGAQSVEEIAISIASELILVRRTGKSDSNQLHAGDHDLAVLETLAQPVTEPFVLATILQTSGSTPRRAGARMLVFADREAGSIGGGCVEAMALQIGKRLIGSGQFEVLDVDIDGKKAVSRGTACGGTLTVLLEDVPCEK